MIYHHFCASKLMSRRFLASLSPFEASSTDYCCPLQPSSRMPRHYQQYVSGIMSYLCTFGLHYVGSWLEPCHDSELRTPCAEFDGTALSFKCSHPQRLHQDLMWVSTLRTRTSYLVVAVCCHCVRYSGAFQLLSAGLVLLYVKLQATEGKWLVAQARAVNLATSAVHCMLFAFVLAQGPQGRILEWGSFCGVERPDAQPLPLVNSAVSP